MTPSINETHREMNEFGGLCFLGRRGGNKKNLSFSSSFPPPLKQIFFVVS